MGAQILVDGGITVFGGAHVSVGCLPQRIQSLAMDAFSVSGLFSIWSF